MGNLLMVSLDRLASAVSSPCHIVMLGLDNSGKTSLMYKAKLKENVKVHPTTAFNVECVNATKKLKFKIWDIGGREANRPLWRAYVRKTEGMVFVVDSTDSSRFDEARHELFNLLNSESAQLNDVPILVLANKQDCVGAVSPDMLARELNLAELNDRHLWTVEPTSACIGEGFADGLKTLGKMIARCRGDYLREPSEEKTPKLTRRNRKKRRRNRRGSAGSYEGVLI
ncbi:ADP-ribosylation factor 6-like [Dendronephthya gigantea]|uniref:ADP-ribosylation factor 6-like n=1 Tax=Dendronephthya gigantea TaxID=151771 RepID=UPI00106B0C44|nr:ADP-ribosylation factor 6-like [Dendronephthya gigantea]